MAKKQAQDIGANDYLSQISLDIKEGDLVNNPALVKKFLAELKEAKADNLGLRDSLESTQDTLEAEKKSYHELDKENAVLKSAAKTKLGISILQDTLAAGFGGGIGAFVAGQAQLGFAICVPTFLLYVGCRIINSK